MSSRDRSRAIGACLCCLVSLAILALAGGGLRGDEGDGQEARTGKVRVGVFESRAIAVAFVPSKYHTRTRDLKVEHDKARAAGDKQKMEELEEKARRGQDRLHRQGFGLALVDDLLEPIKDSFPEICREAKVDLIAQYVVHPGPDVELVDVTDLLVKRYDPSEKTLKTVAEIKKHPPLSHDKFPIND